MKRREFLAAGALALGLRAAAVDEKRIRDYLGSIKPTEKRIRQFTRQFTPEESMRLSNGWTWDAELGWVHCDAFHSNGVDDSKTFYHYESDGARKVVNCPDAPCRIHAYGNSFTHCDQVNDNETWEEYLAAHLQEPVRNYGVGGYGVYQAYRRLLKVERDNPADYIILNIWDDDHYRSLDAWRSIRFGRGSQCGFPLPHVRVNVRDGRCEQVENVVGRREDMEKLRHDEFLFRTFKDDPVLHLVLARRAASPQRVEAVAASFGISTRAGEAADPAHAMHRIHTEAALFATRHILTWTEEFAARTGKKLLLVLSFGKGTMARELRGGPRFDRSLVQWLAGKPYPVVDMRDLFAREYRTFKGDADAFLRRYYNGHHTPAGNFFTALGLKDRIVEWLDPPPAPYR